MVFLFFLFSTPSTVYWSPCTPYLQPYGIGHITYDSYFRNQNDFPTTIGFTTGLLPYKNFQIEFGYDGIMPSDPPSTAHSFNFKFGTPEGAVIPFGISAGYAGIGFEKDVSDYNVFHIDLGRTLKQGAFSFGYYSGNKNILGDSNSGFMAGYLSPDIPSPIKGIKKLVFASDYMGGDNLLSAWGFGVYFYFTDKVDLLTGPVFPLSEKFPGGKDFIWTLQLDIDFEL